MIAAGTQVVVSGAPSIVITNGKWQNDGTFTAGNSVVRMEGNASTANSTIGGAGATTFYDLTQQKSSFDVLLTANIGVTNNLTMNGGLFQLNNFFVTLGTATGQIVNETELNRVTGTTGGEIIKVMTLNAPAGVNPGNLGAMITSAANMGVTTIRRGHVQQNDGNAGLSIFRYYDIFPTNNTGLSATLRQFYFDAELGGRLESELAHYNSLNGGLSWYGRGFTARNTTTNFVDNSTYADFSTRWTLASPLNQPLPVSFVNEGIRCDADRAVLFWTVVESPGGDYFQVQKSQDQIEWVDVADGHFASQGTGRHQYAYTLTEAAEFYRVRQVDVGGGWMVSDAHRLTCNVAGDWAIWPNPTNANLNIKAPFGQAITGLEIADMYGQIILRKTISDADVTQYAIDLSDRLSASMYTLKIFAAKGNPVVKKFEVRR